MTNALQLPRRCRESEQRRKTLFITSLLGLAALSLTGCADAPTASGAADHGSVDSPKAGYVYASVEHVFDGDSFSARAADGKPLEVRAAEIDAPEKGEPYANRARQRARQLLNGKQAAIRQFDVDRYGRIVGRVFVDGTDLSATLVSEGLAGVHRRYAEDQRLYALEAEAREARRGFWSTDYRPRGVLAKQRD